MAVSSSRRLNLLASFLLFILPLAQPHETGELLKRIMRDTSGRYHPEIHGATHSVTVENRGNLDLSQLSQLISSSTSVSSNSLDNGDGEGHHHTTSVGASSSSHSSEHGAHATGGSDWLNHLTPVSASGYSYGPELLTPFPESGYSYPSVITPGIEPNCGCQQSCGESTLAYTNAVIQARASTLVCGRAFRLCCIYNDPPWPGVTDAFRDVIACVPREDCVREYGQLPTDVRDYGTIPPCPGQGAVRCLDGRVQIVDTQLIPAPSGPTHFVIPILEQPQPTPVIPTPVTPVFTNVPATTYDVPQPTPIVPVPVPVPVPTPTYVAPVPDTPVAVPVTSYGPPSGSYEAPAPVPVPVAPAPVPVTTYDVPVAVPVTTYDAPVAVPVTTYDAPVAVPVDVPVAIPDTSYGPPQAVPELPIPSTSYGVPGLAAGAPLGLYNNRGPYSPGLYSRLGGFGYNKGLRFGGGYPGYGGYSGFGYPGGLGFRKHFSINKGFGFAG